MYTQHSTRKMFSQLTQVDTVVTAAIGEFPLLCKLVPEMSDNMVYR